MEQRISLVTLGVSDLGRAVRFYTDLGWERGNDGDEVAFFQCGGIVVALWGRAELEKDSVVTDSGGWGGITLAHNVRSPEEVDRVLSEEQAAGGVIGRPGAATEWGGYSGIFIDPDGHPWEVAHNPFWTITDDGRTLLGADPD